MSTLADASLIWRRFASTRRRLLPTPLGDALSTICSKVLLVFVLFPAKFYIWQAHSGPVVLRLRLPRLVAGLSSSSSVMFLYSINIHKIPQVEYLFVPFTLLKYSLPLWIIFLDSSVLVSA